MATKEFDYFVTPNRQIRNVQFDYINNRLSRVIIFYMRVNFNDYEKLKEQYPDQAGVLHLENYEADSASINFTPQS